MKATMSPSGMITLQPETTVEAYALSKWVEHALIQVNDVQRAEGCYWRGSALMVTAELPK